MIGGVGNNDPQLLPSFVQECFDPGFLIPGKIFRGIENKVMIEFPTNE